MEIEFSDAPLEGAREQYEQWEEVPEFLPPPKWGNVRGFIDQIREEKEYDTAKGKRLSVTVDLKLVGGEDDDRVVTYQRFSNQSFDSKATGTSHSFLLDLIKSAGVRQAPLSNKDYATVVRHLRDTSTTFSWQGDWEGNCMTCFYNKLKEITQTTSDAEAKRVATPDQKKEANKFSKRARDFRGFPTIDGTDKRRDSFTCETCKGEVRAQYRVKRFLRPVA